MTEPDLSFNVDIRNNKYYIKPYGSDDSNYNIAPYIDFQKGKLYRFHDSSFNGQHIKIISKTGIVSQGNVNNSNSNSYVDVSLNNLDISGTDLYYDNFVGGNLGHGPITVYDVKVVNDTNAFGTGDKYSINLNDGNGYQITPPLDLSANNTYRFDLSGTYSGELMRFSSSPKGLNEYTNTVDISGTHHRNGAYSQIRVTHDTSNVSYYFNGSDISMGNSELIERYSTKVVRDTVADISGYQLTDSAFEGNIFRPDLKVLRETAYRFDVSDPSNTGHELQFDTATGILNGTPGQPGAYVELQVTPNTSSPVLYFGTNSALGGNVEVYSTMSDLLQTWAGDTTANRLRHSYHQGFVDVSGVNANVNTRGDYIDISSCRINFDISHIPVSSTTFLGDVSYNTQNTNVSRMNNVIYGLSGDVHKVLLGYATTNGAVSYDRDKPEIYQYTNGTWNLWAQIPHTDQIAHYTMSYDTNTVALSNSPSNAVRSVYIYYQTSPGIYQLRKHISNNNSDSLFDTYYRPTLSGQAFDASGSRLVIGGLGAGTNDRYMQIETYDSSDHWNTFNHRGRVTPPSSASATTTSHRAAYAYISHNGQRLHYLTSYAYGDYYPPELGFYTYDNNSWNSSPEYHRTLFNGLASIDNKYSVFTYGGSPMSPDGSYCFIRETLYKRQANGSWTETHGKISTSGQETATVNQGYNIAVDPTSITNGGKYVIKYIDSTNKIHIYKNDGADNFSEYIVIENANYGTADAWCQTMQCDLSYGSIVVSSNPTHDSNRGIGSVYELPSTGLPVPTQITNIDSQDSFEFVVVPNNVPIKVGSYDSAGFFQAIAKNFAIEHPLKPNYKLRHTCIETPGLATMYSGHSQLLNGSLEVNLDEIFQLSEGTFSALNEETYAFTSNESGYDEVKGKVEGNILTIECENATSEDKVSWIIFGKRNDEYVKQAHLLDASGNYIAEY